MSISQDSAATIVCREVFDETSHPSNEEVLDYAIRLGIDPDAEPHLLDLAREGLMAALPKGWQPCFHEASGAWYYYQASTGTTRWVHPLDPVYKELVKQARAGNARQMSVEEDSKTTAKDLESHEEATLPKEASSSKDTLKSAAKPNPASTRIPTKLTPLKKLDKVDGVRKRENTSLERQHSRRESEPKLDNPLATDRAARDYTSLKFQDPRFYECPKILESVPSTSAAGTATALKQELDLTEVLKRSESLSPRDERDWEQLSSKFSSEENIIDIDKLSVTTLARSEKPEKFDKEKHPSQFSQQKELTLNGGGTMFLKSNRSRDTTPSQEGAKLEDFRTVTISDECCNIAGDKLKSILREKQSDDDDRPVDEERKSVRFDIEKEVCIKFTYSGSEDDWESESEEQNVKASDVASSNLIGSIVSPKFSQSFDDENKEDSESKAEEDTKRSSSSDKLEALQKSSKVIGRRFVVQNVTENEHRSQMARESSSRESVSRESSLEGEPIKKFDRMKNIDLVAKSETDCSLPRSSDSEEFRRSRSKVDKPKKTIGFSRDRQADDGDTPRANEEVETESYEELKAKLMREHPRNIELLKKEFEDKLEQTKMELEENFLEQKRLLQKNLNDRLEELKREMTEKEEREIQWLIAEMDETRLENLQKVKAELEVCYEKERQEILANLKTELDDRKRELLELRNQEMGKLESEHERSLGEEKLAKLSELELTKQHTEKIEAMKQELQKEFDDLCADLRAQQWEKITKITEDHEKRLTQIIRDFRVDEELTRKMHQQTLEDIVADFSRDAQKEARKQAAQQQESMDMEKMRSENRLLQDKYTALKKKYSKLTNNVRLVVEKSSSRKMGYTTASETERSTSTRTRTDRTESSEQNTPVRKTRSCSAATNVKPQEAQATGEQQAEVHRQPEEAAGQKGASGFQKVAAAAAAMSKSTARFESDDTTTASETNANMMKKRKNFSKRTSSAARAGAAAAAAAAAAGNNNNNNPENPVENIRKQLEKLEDLGDQLPSNETAYTLRYPFQDKAPANASSELEFFRHRIHVERDSVRRAQEALRHQENAFQSRQRAWKQRIARATLEQLLQEEGELSDMEVRLHRTKSLLGEKVIYLRHLEQTLERVVSAKRTVNDATLTRNDEMTLSDMGSASSGFSSTDLGTDTFIDKPDHYQESTEITASLENLNSEIREIWGVLNKWQDSNVPPPPTLMSSYLPRLRFHHLTVQPNNVQGTFGTPHIQSNILSQITAAQPPTTTTQNIIAQYGPNSGFTTSVGTVEKSTSNLIERTCYLKDWLRLARVENTDLITSAQATL